MRIGRAPLTLLLAGLAVAAVAVFYVRAVHPTVAPKNFGVVKAGMLYRSGALTPAATERVVREHAIKTIVDLGGFDKSPEDDLAAARTALALGVTRHAFRLNGDGTGNPDFYVEALEIMGDPANQPVLVHCSAGSQRTGACVMLYHKIFEGVPFEQSLAEARVYGHDPENNPKLLKYLEKNGAEIQRRVEAWRAGGGGRSAAADAPEPTRTMPP